MQEYNILDITNEIDDLPKSLKIKDKNFPIDEDRKTVQKALAITKLAKIKKQKGEPVDEDKMMDDIITLLIGENGFNELQEMKLSYQNYGKVFMGLMALVSGKTMEEMKAQTGGRFQ